MIWNRASTCVFLGGGQTGSKKTLLPLPREKVGKKFSLYEENRKPKMHE